MTPLHWKAARTAGRAQWVDRALKEVTRAIRLAGPSGNGGKIAAVLKEQLRMADEERSALRQDLSAERRSTALLERRVLRAEQDNEHLGEDTSRLTVRLADVRTKMRTDAETLQDQYASDVSWRSFDARLL